MTSVAGEEKGKDGPQGPELEGAHEDGTRYSRSEWRGAVAPALVFVTLLILVLVAHYLLRDTGSEWHPLDDVDDSGSFDLPGRYEEELTAYGAYAYSINVTLDRSDRLTLSYRSNGPPDGIQVRLQHPLHPTDGIDGTGGAEVFSSSAGGNGSIDFFTREGGAYQVYFWHPGSAREPGPGDDPDIHVTATVTYDLQVIRGHRP